jgi:hypothetical protein
MRKITFLLFTLVLTSFAVNAQHTFATIPGPVTVASDSGPTTLSINDVGNSAGVPAGTYNLFTVTVDWGNPIGDPWSSEADLTITTSAGSVTIDPATSGAANSGAATTLTFSGGLPGGDYDPSVDGFLEISLNQSYAGSSADWSNISVLIDFTPPPPPPATIGTITIGSATCGVQQTITDAYDPAVSDVDWVLFVYDGSCEAVTFDTFTSAFEDTELGVYAENGSLLGSNDDAAGGGLLSELILPSLSAGNYYIAIGGFNTTFGTGFAATSNTTDAAADIVLNIIADAPLSLGEIENENAFSYFPNPVNDKLTLRAQNNIQNVSIYNMLGQEVVRTAPNTLTSDVDMNTLSSGAYFVQVTINDTTETIRILKK